MVENACLPRQIPFALANPRPHHYTSPQLAVMTSDPPASPEGGELPPRHRPNLGNLAKDTTEKDLWAFDDLDDDLAMTERLRPGAETIVPQPRDSAKPAGKQALGKKPSEPHDKSVVTLGRTPVTTPRQAVTPSHSQPGDDFDELDRWDEPAALAEPPAEHPVAALEVPSDDELEPPPPSRPEPSPTEPAAPAPTAPAPLPLRPRLGLSKIERIGMVVLAVLLLGGGIVVYVNTISRLPTGDSRADAEDFPIKGKLLTVSKATSYWRLPTDSDPVRRGTQLIPEVEITTAGSPAAVRVFFRNSDGEVVGDPVTRMARPGETFLVAATAGFDDLGMHAAYRTEKARLWVIEVLEGPSENSPGNEFHPLFESIISPERR